MLQNLDQQPPDALLALIKMYADDPRSDKIDLGVGVYRTDDGATPVFASIKAAEQRLVDEQESKGYLGPEGDMGFVRALKPHIFGRDPAKGGRIEGMQTPGGTGAVRLAVSLAEKAGAKTIHLGVPSWPNHAQILTDVGLEAATFPHARADGTADLDAVLDIIDQGGADEAILLHGCCHNPTGVDYTRDDWDAIAAACAESKVLMIIDTAYQGLGEGLDEDAYGVRAVVGAAEQALICYSCDKNFGLYRDRVGALYVLAKGVDDLPRIMSNANALARANWSMPPDHGAAAVRLVLRDEGLTAVWQAELQDMRERLRWVRQRLAQADNEVGGLDLAPLGTQNGMFATLPMSKEQIAKMRSEHGVYMAGSGRINVAGLTRGNIDAFIAALAAVTA